MLKKMTYNTDKGPLEITYDSEDPCVCCELPVVEASMGGTSICPWCDMGVDRKTGKRLSMAQMYQHSENFRHNTGSATDYAALVARTLKNKSLNSKVDIV